MVNVDLTTSHDLAAGGDSQVKIHGSVASRTSAELARKVLTTDKVQRCRVIKVTRIGRS